MISRSSSSVTADEFLCFQVKFVIHMAQLVYKHCGVAVTMKRMSCPMVASLSRFQVPGFCSCYRGGENRNIAHQVPWNVFNVNHYRNNATSSSIVGWINACPHMRGKNLTTTPALHLHGKFKVQIWNSTAVAHSLPSLAIFGTLMHNIVSYGKYYQDNLRGIRIVYPANPLFNQPREHKTLLHKSP